MPPKRNPKSLRAKQPIGKANIVNNKAGASDDSEVPVLVKGRPIHGGHAGFHDQVRTPIERKLRYSSLLSLSGFNWVAPV